MNRLYRNYSRIADWIGNNRLKSISIVLILFIGYFIITAEGYDFSGLKYSSNTIDCADVQSIARQFVKQQLKAPSTADFPYDDYEYECVEKTNNRWLVKSYVDAENSFGAKLRQKWWVEMKYKKSTDKWELLNIAVY